MRFYNFIILSLFIFSFIFSPRALADDPNDILFEILLKFNRNICHYIKLPDYQECDYDHKTQKVKIKRSHIISPDNKNLSREELRRWVNNCGAVRLEPLKKCILVGNKVVIVDDNFHINESLNHTYKLQWQKSCYGIEAQNFRCIIFNADELNKQLSKKDNSSKSNFENFKGANQYKNSYDGGDAVALEYFQERDELINALNKANDKLDQNNKDQKNLKLEHAGNWVIFVQEKKIERIAGVAKAVARKDIVGAASAVVGSIDIVKDMIEESEKNKAEREQLKTEHRQYKNEIDELKDQIIENEKTIERMKQIPPEHKPKLEDKIEKTG